MKSKLLLIVMCSIVLCACSKLPYGDIGKEDIGKDEEIILTENNYIYEGELLKFVLNKDIDSLEARIKELKSLSGKGLTLEDELLESDNGYLSPLPGTEGYIQIQEVNVNELIVNENITLSIERKDKNGMNFIYSISTIVQK